MWNWPELLETYLFQYIMQDYIPFPYILLADVFSVLHRNVWYEPFLIIVKGCMY